MSIARTKATGEVPLDPKFLAWSSSLHFDRRLLRVDCQGSAAHVEGLRAAGLLRAEEATVLIDALSRLPDRVEQGDVALPDEEDVHMAVEALLRAELGPVVDKLHTGRSRNDQVATDLALFVRATCDDLEFSLNAVEAAAARFVAREGETPMPAYTHRQVAVPVLARTFIEGALVCGLRRDRELLAGVRREASVSPLGAGAVGGTTLPLDPALTERLIGFAQGPVNPIDAVANRDAALALVFTCARIGLHLGRFAADVVELASDGLCRLSGRIACGSSMMPHKRNPDLFELVRGEAAKRQGELVALLTTFHGLGSGYHRDLQQDKAILFAAVDGTRSCLEMIALGLDELSLVGSACLAALARGDAIATDLTEALVAGGMPFRDAYRAIGALVAETRAQGRSLMDLGAADLEARGLPATLAESLDLSASAKKRSGSPQR